jgi:hypothetical protein
MLGNFIKTRQNVTNVAKIEIKQRKLDTRAYVCFRAFIHRNALNIYEGEKCLRQKC